MLGERVLVDGEQQEISGFEGIERQRDHVAAGGVGQRLLAKSLGPIARIGRRLLGIFSQRHERGSTIVTSTLPFDEWTSVFGNQRLTGALLDRLTHYVSILELNGESYRLKQSKSRRRKDAPPPNAAVDPRTGEIASA
jgi:hypothetical protein